MAAPTPTQQLYEAASKGDVAQLRALAQAGADVNVTHDYGGTPLEQAIDSQQLGAARCLVELGANARYVNWCTGQTMLQAAMFRGNVDVIRFLLECGVDVEAKASEEDCSSTAMHIVADTAHVGALACLVDEGGAAVDPLDDMDRTPMHYAASNGRTDSVRALAMRGADVNAADCEQSRPVHLAAAPGHFAHDAGHLETVRVLVEELGADPTLVDSENKSARASASEVTGPYLDHWIDVEAPRRRAERAAVLEASALAVGDDAARVCASYVDAPPEYRGPPDSAPAEPRQNNRRVLKMMSLAQARADDEAAAAAAAPVFFGGAGAAPVAMEHSPPPPQ